MSKGKTKRILLGILLAGSITNVAHADYTYEYVDYTGKISATDATYTYTDAEGTEHKVAYKTVDMDSVTSTTVEKTVLTDYGTSSGNTYTESGKMTIGGTEVDFNVYYTANGETHTTGIDNSTYIENITGTFQGLLDKGDTSHEYASAIYNTGTIGTITAGFISDGDSEGSSAYEYGGAIYNGGTITSISESYFLGNVLHNSSAGPNTDEGVAIFNDIGNSIGNITGSFFAGNQIVITNENNSGTESDWTRGVIFNGGTIGTGTGTGISGSYFIGNSTTVTHDGASRENIYAYGGVIFNNTTGTIYDINSSYFIGNSISVTHNGSGIETNNVQGGAIYNQGAIESITESYFIGNSISVTNNGGGSETDNAQGGAIYNHSGGTINSITGSYFVENTAVDGGAIYAYAVDSSIGTIKNSYFLNNTADGGNGGAIYIDRPSINEITGSYFSGNSATDGGAIYIGIYGGSLGSISGTYFVENSAAGSGGAIYTDGTSSYASGPASIGNIESSYFIENKAAPDSGAAMGGAIYNSDKGTIGSTAGTYFIGNSAVSTDEIAYGGAIYNAGTMGSDGITVAYLVNNHAEGYTGAYGGAIYDTVNTSVTVTGSATGNYVKTASGDVAGGVIYLEQAASGETTTISVIGDVVENHAETASGSAQGGAFYNNEAGTLTIGGGILGNYVSATGGNAYGGAIYNAGSLTVKNGVTLIGNYAVSTDGEAAGGAIYNASTGTTAASEGTLSFGDVIGNYAEGATSAKGGAIYDAVNTEVTITGDASYNYVNVTGSGDVAGGVLYLEKAASGETTVSVTGNVTGNYAKTASGTAMGGAFYNNADGTLSIGKDISKNYVSGTEGAKGGAIYNEGTLDISGTTTISGNYATATKGNAQGGAIYNEGSIGTIKGAFTGNYASASGGYAAGGAIYNSGIGSIESFTATALSGNYAVSEGSYAEGGAIYNDNSDTAITVTGDITNNYVTASTMAAGGAIYSMGNVTAEGGSITGNYAEGASAYGGAILNSEAKLTVNAAEISGNYATATTGNAAGGAIYNIDEGTLTVTATSIASNYAKSESGDAQGGAIYNEDAAGSITVTGDVTGNYADASGTAAGGAIYNAGTVTINGNITGNYAKGDTAEGGAIYNAGTVNINIENQDAVISGNYTESGGTQEANVLYGEAGSVTNFNLTDASLTLEDSVTGETGFEVNVKGNGTDATTFYMLNDILDSNLSFDSTTINTINNEVHAYSVNKLSINGDVNFVADVDLANETMDRFTASEYGDHAGKLNVSGMHLISDTENDSVEIPFAEAGLKDNVTSSVGTLPDSKNQQKAYTPLYEYNVAYDNRDDAGYFTFDKTGNNPSADVPEEAEAAAISFMNLMYRYAFEHSDYYMKLPRNVRQAIIKGENCAEDENCLENYRAYNGHNLTDPGIWVKPFASNETVPFGHQFTARTKNYGLLVGVDTAFKERGRWANVFTGYVGYDGIRQTFSGNSTEQYGGLLGVTDTVYNGNFFAAVTLSGGDNVLKAKTMYGREKTHLYMGGAAVKTGYNMEFAGGNYSFLPTFMASYTYANIKDYTSASGLKMDSNGMHAVELNPNFKFIRNLASGWMPYATVGEIWTVGQHSDVRASGTLLDELTFRPYTEYGLGVQKMWSKGYDGYAEFLGHAGGRRGFLINLGFRWAFN